MVVKIFLLFIVAPLPMTMSLTAKATEDGEAGETSRGSALISIEIPERLEITPQVEDSKRASSQTLCVSSLIDFAASTDENRPEIIVAPKGQCAPSGQALQVIKMAGTGAKHSEHVVLLVEPK